MDDQENQRSGYPLTIPNALLQSEAMQQACAARNFQEIFRLVNRRTGSSYADMAAAIGKMTSSRVSDIVRGVRGIRGHEVIERVADGFGIPGEMLGLPRRPWEGSPKGIDGTINARTSVKAVEDPEAQARAQYVRENAGSLDLLAVAELRQQVQILDARYVTEPSTALIAEIGQHLGQLAYWHTHTTTYAVRRDLYAAQAEASILMGQLVWDASGRTDHGTPRTYFAQAAEAARELRDPVAEGLALLRTSFIALYGEKNPRAGLELAQHTVDIVESASRVLTGLGVLHAAEAYAMLRQRRDCEKALNSAELHFGQVDVNDAGASMLSPGQFGRLAGSCFLSLNDTARAQVILESAVKEVRKGSKSHAITLGNLALTHIRQREIEEAAGRLGEAIDIVERHRGGGGLNLIFQAGRELQSWRDVPAVRNLNDRLLSLIAST
ncbi:transcriptional regulator [Streptomyces litchfieldiae]|uniref:Transcriptional regulator n=1 Tax=Streptomyces litchfieldiae TaxID=3075543 RepID=A0ABU2MJH3_9ACTN|nr:transcriptional regulator [Streptomyces sp. DSM 44938]MDT0341734.1 transcriptional regulator [Streptomyces sp. DSM 44938]